MTKYAENDLPEQEDLALATLKAVAMEDDSGLPLDLVVKLYQLQKKHQFDADRGASVQEMQRLLEQYVDSLDEGGSK